MNINLEYYKIFCYVVEYGSFTMAAEQLCISQPAVSQGIKQLETNLGSKLFIRTPKGVKLTKEGEVLYTYVKRGYEYILLGESTFQKMIDLENGEIRIGASDMTLEYYLLPYLERFHEKYPNIKVTVTNAPTPETIEYLYHGKIDFGIVSTPFEAKSDIQRRDVREIRDVFIAGRKFLQLKNRTLQYEELKNLPFICLERNTSSRRYTDAFLGEQGIYLQPEFELATSDIIVQFVKRNLGIGCVVEDIAKSFIESGEVFALLFNRKIPSRTMSIITSEQNPISTAAKVLLEMMEEE